MYKDIALIATNFCACVYLGIFHLYQDKHASGQAEFFKRSLGVESDRALMVNGDALDPALTIR